MTVEYTDIIEFWFTTIDQKQWFKKDDDFDQLLLDQYSEIHSRAAKCELFTWRTTAQGRLAEIIVLDQFSRNMFRHTPLAFAFDPMALALAQEAVASGLDKKLEPLQRLFLYMPYMHSESLLVHDEALRLFTELGLEKNLQYEIKHQNIIKRYGRYPHRNELLGRESTPDEVSFLAQPGSSF